MSVSAEPTSRELIDGRFMWRVFYVFAALALVSLAISLGGRHVGRSIAMAGHTDDTSAAEVVIGDNVLLVPRNTIRFPAARAGGSMQRLDLYLRWPDLAGYSDATRDDFNHAAGAPSIVFVSIGEQVMSRDMSGRYEPIYQELTEPTGVFGPAGLSIRKFTDKSGYLNEVLFTAARPNFQPYVARCLDGPSAADSLAPCERDILVGKRLSLSYRFPRELLGEWKALDARIAAAAQDMLRSAR